VSESIFKTKIWPNHATSDQCRGSRLGDLSSPQ